MHIKKYSNKILLVDDNPKNLQVAMNILKDFNVIYAQSGQKALELIEKNHFDLILLDIVMPVLDGYEVCKKIKASEKHKDIPIIFLTVKDDEKDIVKGFEYGAVDYITKPFYSAVLLKRVELHLNLAKAIDDLKEVNINLNNIVSRQVEDIRKKEEILFQQSKISAMSDMIDVLSLNWKQPLNMIKLYLQSLGLKIDDIDAKETLEKISSEVLKLDDTMYDFQKFFKNDIQKQNVNVKVLIENVLFLVKDDIVKNKVSTKIDGDHLLELNIVSDELKHIILKLITSSIENICKDGACCDISFLIEESNNEKKIRYVDNVSKINETCNIINLYEPVNSDNFDLGLYLLKVFIEKNQGKLIFNEAEKGLDLTISFNK